MKNSRLMGWPPPPSQVDILRFHHCLCGLQHSLESCQATPSFPLTSQSFTKQMTEPQEGEAGMWNENYVARHVSGMTVESEWQAAGIGSGLESRLEGRAGCFLDFGIGSCSGLI